MPPLSATQPFCTGSAVSGVDLKITGTLRLYQQPDHWMKKTYAW